MENVQKIVVPVDFSKSTNKLAGYAIYMAERLAAVVHFVHVVADFPADVMIGAPFAQEYQEKAFASSQEKMTNLVRKYQKQCPGCTGKVVYGAPVDEIVEFAGNMNADLLIISTHGAKGLEKILLGSVAERVLNSVHCPVLMMNPYKELQSEQYYL